mgnify:CR=1 FL=1
MTASVQNDAAFDGWSHVIYDLSKTAHLIQGRKRFNRFFEIRSLSKIMRKTAPFFKHYDFSNVRYLIKRGFQRHIILRDAKCNWYEHKNHTK